MTTDQEMSFNTKAQFGFANTNEERDSFIRLINKLAFFCRGYQRELDHKLGQVRQQLQAKKDVVSDNPTLKQLEQLLVRHALDWEQQLRVGQLTLKQRVSALLKKRNQLPSSMVTALLKLDKRLTAPISNVFALLHCYGQLFTCYEKTFQHLAPVNVDTPAQPSLKHELRARLVSHFEALLAEQTFSNKELSAFTEYLNQLHNAANEQDFLSQISNWLSFTLQTLAARNEQARAFLCDLSLSLHCLQQRMAATHQQLAEQHQAQQRREQLLNAQLASLQKELCKADNLDELKSIINSQITTLQRTVNGETTPSSATSPQQQYQQLQKELVRMQQEADAFRHQLHTQKNLLLKDHLTGLPNRTAYDERLAHYYTQRNTSHEPLTIAIVDLDFFKEINDTYGHSAGDRTLQVVAKMLMLWSDDKGFVARYGGEEFVLLLPNKTIQQAAPLLRELCQRIAHLHFTFKGQAVRITASIGAADFELGEKPDQVFEKADKALYAAKDKGRNQIVLAMEP